jgi:hypothetical protein
MQFSKSSSIILQRKSLFGHYPVSLTLGEQRRIQMTTKVEQEFMTPSHVMDTAALPAAVSSSLLLGTWKNIVPTTRDVVKVVIAAAGAGISVNAFGACTPTPCNWGVVSGLAYAANVSSTAAVAFSAQYRFSFAVVILVGHLQGKQLLIETFTHFTDGSGRSDMYTTDTLAK